MSLRIQMTSLEEVVRRKGKEREDEDEEDGGKSTCLATALLTLRV